MLIRKYSMPLNKHLDLRDFNLVEKGGTESEVPRPLNADPKRKERDCLKDSPSSQLLILCDHSEGRTHL